VGSAEQLRVARADELAWPGSQRAVRVGTEGILLVRGRDGELRAFSNVCRHRGHELLAPGETRVANAIRCPYHAWVYALDGRLAGASRFGPTPSFDREDYPLIGIPVAERGGWVVAEL
jgi:glycine betaine catabolism A